MQRKHFIRLGLTALVTPRNLLARAVAPIPHVMTVRGAVPASELGFTLSHEHILVDFIGVKPLAPVKNLLNEATSKALPHLQRAYAAGCRTIVECTTAGLGRDPAFLKTLSDQTGLNILTNTGYYGAAGEKYLPAHVYTQTACQLASRWINEWEEGIDNTGIKPGFIKLGVDNGPLSAAHQKLVEAACYTHLQTGLSIAVHSGDGAAAMEQMALLQKMNVSPRAWIWVHAQNELNNNLHLKIAASGGWVSFDGLDDTNTDEYLKFLTTMKKAGLLQQALISHDAGWYHVGIEKGGHYRGYTTVFDKLIPAMKTKGFSADDIATIFINNPANAFAISIKKLQ